MRIDVGNLSELQESGYLTAKLGTQPVCVFWHEGRAYGIDDRCPHLGFPLHRGTLDAGIELAWDLRVGEQAAQLHPRPVHPRADLRLDRRDRQPGLRRPSRQAGHLSVEIPLLVMARHSGVQPGLARPIGTRPSRGDQHAARVDPRRRHRHRQRPETEPPIGSLRVYPLLSCLLSHLHRL